MEVSLPQKLSGMLVFLVSPAVNFSGDGHAFNSSR
jgi:hypothetical protein